MRKLVALVALFCLAMGNVAWSAPKIAVVDVRAAVVGSSAAKQQMEKLRADLAGEEAELMALRDSIQGMEEKFKKDEVTMSGEERRRTRQSIEDKVAEFNFMGERLQKRTQEAQQGLLQSMLPLVERALAQLKDEKKYDLILRKEATLWASEEYDITQALIDKMNASKP